VVHDLLGVDLGGEPQPAVGRREHQHQRQQGFFDSSSSLRSPLRSIPQRSCQQTDATVARVMNCQHHLLR